MYDSVNNASSDKPEERYYAYGYMDGYFGEHIYMKQFLMDINEYYNQEYSFGYVDGVHDKINTNNNSKLKREKEEFFKKLAVYDVIKEIDRRVLSSEKKYPLYHDYKRQTESAILHEGQYRKDNGVTKRRKVKSER